VTVVVFPKKKLNYDQVSQLLNLILTFSASNPP